jgi:hypothetical protein
MRSSDAIFELLAPRASSAATAASRPVIAKRRIRTSRDGTSGAARWIVTRIVRLLMSISFCFSSLARNR